MRIASETPICPQRRDLQVCSPVADRDLNMVIKGATVYIWRFTVQMSFRRLFKFVSASPRAANMTKQYSTPSVLYTKIDKRPPEVVRSHGNYLETSDGRTIFDASGGAAVACLGHNEPRVKQAIMEQLDQTAYVYSPFFTVPAAEEVATYLTESTNGAMSKVFIVSSGMAVMST